MNVGLRPDIENVVLILSAPEILQRPTPQRGAPLFGAPRPERPRAPAKPGCCRDGEAAACASGAGPARW